MFCLIISDIVPSDSSAAVGILTSSEPCSTVDEVSMCQDPSAGMEMNVTADNGADSTIVSALTQCPSTPTVTSTYTQSTV